MPSAHWDTLALWMPHKKGPRCQSSLRPHWLDISYPRFLPLRAATSTSSDGQESFHLSRLPTTPADSVCLGFKLSNNKGRVLKLHSLWFLIKQPESRVKGMPKTRVQMNPQTSPNAFPVSHEHVLQRQSQHLQQGVGIVQGTGAQIFFYVFGIKVTRTGAMRIKAVWPAIGKDSWLPQGFLHRTEPQSQ